MDLGACGTGALLLGFLPSMYQGLMDLFISSRVSVTSRLGRCRFLPLDVEKKQKLKFKIKKYIYYVIVSFYKNYFSFNYIGWFLKYQSKSVK